MAYLPVSMKLSWQVMHRKQQPTFSANTFPLAKPMACASVMLHQSPLLRRTGKAGMSCAARAGHRQVVSDSQATT